MTEEEIYYKIAEKLKEERLKQNLSEYQLAELCGFHKIVICNIENHTLQPSLEMIKKLTDALSINIRDLWAICS